MEEERQNEQSTQPVENSGSRPAPWMIIGFIAVVGLVIAAAFLPPFSLGERLGLGGGDAAEETAVTTPATNDADGGEEMAVTGDDVDALPAAVSGVGEAMAIDADSVGTVESMSISYPAGTDGNMVDMYGWNGSDWVFVPSTLDEAGQQIVSVEQPLYAAYALGQPAPSASPIVGAEWMVDGTLAAEIVGVANQITAGPLMLDGSGALQGEISGVPAGDYGRLLHVTNAAAIVDEASLASFLSNADAQAIQIDALVNTASAGGFDGVNIDYQGVADAQSGAFTTFITNLGAALQAEGLQLAVTLGTPQFTTTGWDAIGQDWAAIGQVADLVYVQMPLDPTSYVANGPSQNLLRWATRQVDRRKLVASVNGGAVDRLGESFIALSNDEALANFGEIQFTQGGETVGVNEPIEAVLSGNATPLEWDGTSLTYRYSYEDNGQNHFVWLSNPAALGQRLSLAGANGLAGVSVSGLGDVSDSASYAAALGSVTGQSTPPEAAGVAIVWTLLDADGSVIASESGSATTFSWPGGAAGEYTLNAEFAIGEDVAMLDMAQVAVADAAALDEELATASQADEEEAEEEEVVEEAEEEEVAEAAPEPTAAPPATFDPGANDAVVNTNANVRTGPGLSYGTIAGGASAGTAVNLIGRASDNSWFQVVLPDGQEGWIFNTLLTINSSFDVAGLEVVEVESPVAGGGDGGGGGAAPPPPAPISGSFELGGQTAGLPVGAMNSAGMTWIKRQHKWSPGNSGTDVQGLITEGHNAGFKVLLSIPGQLNPSSIDFAAYANFLGQVAALPDPPDAIEVWNEMNITREWPNGQINPSSYVNDMLKPAYTAIKNANPNILVITGAPAPTGFYGGSCGGGGCDDAPYIAGMMAAGAGSFSDCIGVHYNEGIMPPAATSGDPRGSSGHYTRYYQGMVNAYTAAGAGQLCFTEIGYLSGEEWGFVPGGFLWKAPFNLTVAEHAQYLAEAVSLAANSGRVRLFIIFNVDFTTWGDDPQAGYAMIRPNGGCPACETVGAVMRGR